MPLAYRTFETAKAGVEEDRNEDSVYVKKIHTGALMLTLSDGASTGVFSKEWSDHITRGFDSAWLTSPEDFESGLQSLRETFQPEISRPTALRKFLMEGSYATVLAAVIERPTWWFGRMRLNLYAVGDVSLFVFDRSGEVDYIFPPSAREGFGNTPEMLRSNARLQEGSPYTIARDVHLTSPSNLLAFVSDALGEYLYKLPAGEAANLIRRILRTHSPEDFRTIVRDLRENRGMKNDDVTLCCLTDRPDLHFPEPPLKPSVPAGPDATPNTEGNSPNSS